MEQATATFSWSVHPMRERPPLALAAILIITLAATLCGALAGPLYSLLAVLLLIAALNRFFFPSKFTLDDHGLTAEHPWRTTRIAWSEVRRFNHDRHGGYLSRRKNASRWDAYRGVHILFGANGEEAVREIDAHRRSVNEKNKKHADSTETGATR
jgi:hypothetical protein